MNFKNVFDFLEDTVLNSYFHRFFKNSKNKNLNEVFESGEDFLSNHTNGNAKNFIIRIYLYIRLSIVLVPDDYTFWLKVKGICTLDRQHFQVKKRICYRLGIFAIYLRSIFHILYFKVSKKINGQGKNFCFYDSQDVIHTFDNADFKGFRFSNFSKRLKVKKLFLKFSFRI